MEDSIKRVISIAKSYFVLTLLVFASLAAVEFLIQKEFASYRLQKTFSGDYELVKKLPVRIEARNSSADELLENKETHK